MITKVKPCKLCGATTHYPYQCRLNPKTKKSVKKAGKVFKTWSACRKAWKAANPPDEYGYRYCYWHTSAKCLIRIDDQQLTLDHVIPRSRSPQLRFDLSNIVASCIFCNTEKGSRSGEELKAERSAA